MPRRGDGTNFREKGRPHRDENVGSRLAASCLAAESHPALASMLPRPRYAKIGKQAARTGANVEECG
jgi:hypothetical protein